MRIEDGPRATMVSGSCRFASILCALGAAGCGLLVGGDAVECPLDYPVERDGYCYREGDGGLVALDGALEADGSPSQADAGAARDGGAEATDGGGEVRDAGGRKRDAGGEESDGGATVDAGGGADAGEGGTDGSTVVCTGRHPNVMGTRRYCDPGSCYCGDAATEVDVCYVAAIADACCPVSIVCE